MNIEHEINQIKERNKKVELDKAWEISWTRRFSIAIITYFIVVVWLMVTSETNYWLKALVPVIGYLLSTISIPFIKGIWFAEKHEAQSKN